MTLGIRRIEESSVYQDTFAKGEAKGRAGEARAGQLLQGRKKLGPPDERVLAQIAALTDLSRLNLLLEHILDVSTWDELLAPQDR